MYVYYLPLTRMPTKVVPNLSGKCINTLTFLKAVEPKWASYQDNSVQCQWGFFQKGEITIILGSSTPF